MYPGFILKTQNSRSEPGVVCLFNVLTIYVFKWLLKQSSIVAFNVVSYETYVMEVISVRSVRIGFNVGTFRTEWI
jgi:hypothetical protein